MATSSEGTKQAFQKTYQRPKGTSYHCVICGEPMPHPSIRIGDAGQAFEMLGHSTIEHSMKSLFDRTRESTKCADPTLQCLHTQRAKVTWGGHICIYIHIYDKLADRTVMFLNSIEEGVRAL